MRVVSFDDDKRTVLVEFASDEFKPIGRTPWEWGTYGTERVKNAALLIEAQLAEAFQNHKRATRIAVEDYTIGKVVRVALERVNAMLDEHAKVAASGCVEPVEGKR